MTEQEFNTKKLGAYGEQLACDYLIKKGFRIIQKNFRYKKGEIDIICRDKETLVFVEVKSRCNLEFGPPEYAINGHKILQIRKIAKAYLAIHDLNDINCRFDAVTILFKENSTYELNHFENAF